MRIKHRRSNLLTIINLLIEDRAILRQKNKIIQCVKLVNLLHDFEDLILGMKPEIFKQKVFLNELIDILLITHKNNLKLTKIIIEGNFDNFEFEVDRYYFGKALDLLFSQIIKLTTVVKIYCVDNVLWFDYDSDCLEVKSNLTLLEHALDTDIDNNQFGFQLALKILEFLNIEVLLSENVLGLNLKT